MRIQTSPLEFVDFYILQSNIKFIETKKQGIDVKKLFASYEIEIDFSISTEKDNGLLVFLKIEINYGEKRLAGYEIFAEGVAIFDMSKINQFSEEDKSSLLFYSSLSIAINNLRNYLSNLTVSSPFSKYILPAIDVNDLHEKKRKQLENIEKKA